jgi:hypothetical protein
MKDYIFESDSLIFTKDISKLEIRTIKCDSSEVQCTPVIFDDIHRISFYVSIDTKSQYSLTEYFFVRYFEVTKESGDRTRIEKNTSPNSMREIHKSISSRYKEFNFEIYCTFLLTIYNKYNQTVLKQIEAKFEFQVPKDGNFMGSLSEKIEVEKKKVMTNFLLELQTNEQKLEIKHISDL